MAMPRESSFLPTITCSQCNNPVEISMMGEHICAGDAAAEPLPPPNKTYNYGNFDSSYSQPPPAQKYGRMPPPVDTREANRQYQHQDQLTPGSHSGDSQGPSPRTPNARPGVGRPDDYFTPQIASDEPSTPLPSQTRRPGGYGGFGDQNGHDSHSQSPEKPGAMGAMSRMNNITPGPFDSNRRPSTARTAFPRRKESLVGRIDTLEEPPRGLDRPGTANSNASAGSNGVAPPRMPRQNGYGGFGPPSRSGEDSEHVPAMNRSETFPRPSFANESPFRTPSAPGPRPERLRQNSAFEAGPGWRPSMAPDTSRQPPPRKSIIRPSAAGKLSGSVDLAAEFGIGNPYHTPSDSASSGYSNFSSHISQSSTHTSPARSQPIRGASETGKIDDLMSDLETSMDGLRTNGLRIDPAAQGPPRTQSPMLHSPYGISPRDDPAVQNGLSYARPAPSPRFASSPQQDHSLFGPALQNRSRNDSLRMGTSPPSPRALPPSRKGSRDPGAHRGDCKACGQGITGKSISSADGRLTGKYHKACFVCTTCTEPFASAEFYVLDDKPYCEQHYHKLNGSLCGSCCSGIEGEYLEDESRTKYHVGCFRCLDCGRSLSDGYFEVDGMSYCEPDAWKRVHAYEADMYAQQQQPAPQQQPPPPRAGGPGAPRPMNGLPGRPGPGPRGPSGGARPPYGLPVGKRPPPGVGMKPRPQMNKRMTRLGNM